MIHTLSVLGYLSLAAVVNSCAREPAVDGPQRAEGAVMSVAQDTTAVFIQLKFDASGRESTSVVRALRSISATAHPPDLRRRAFPAQVYRLDPAGDSLYLVLAYQPRFSDADGDHWGKTFYVLRASNTVPALSPPLDMKDAEYVVVDSVADVDRDGAADFVYCKGYEGEEDPPRRMAAGYREGRWLDLSDQLRGSRVCPVPRE